MSGVCGLGTHKKEVPDKFSAFGWGVRLMLCRKPRQVRAKQNFVNGRLDRLDHQVSKTGDHLRDCMEIEPSYLASFQLHFIFYILTDSRYHGSHCSTLKSGNGYGWTRMDTDGNIKRASSCGGRFLSSLRHLLFFERLPHYQNDFIMQFSKSLFADFTPILALFAVGAVLVAQVNASALPVTPGNIEAREPKSSVNSIWQLGLSSYATKMKVWGIKLQRGPMNLQCMNDAGNLNPVLRTVGPVTARQCMDIRFSFKLYTSFFYVGILFEKKKKKMGLVENELQKSATGCKKTIVDTVACSVNITGVATPCMPDLRHQNDIRLKIPNGVK
ncbi:hypothetical protein K435DRAFT_797932 [Dendrothele bispora CBS 962.96]|uniref:Uncharacterized protein n=1 Tax=Dendrothele bispora (strain CBS 962.96) TaxID=1314807 RepID=A0A4S8M1C3_DENBC|nr:hypothetical protein K435DRAFT_797932 [Dendrothele bispora CBS 962.96]